MTPEQFASLSAEGYNRIPVSREVLADLDTPLSTYMKLAQQPYSYLLESVQGGEKWGRYSIIGLPSSERIEVQGYDFKLFRNNQLVSSETVTDPLAAVEAFQAQYKVAPLPDQPRFTGGLVGYFGHDTIRYIEPSLNNPEAAARMADPLKVPDILLMVSEDVVVFDNLSGKLLLITHANPADTDALEKAQQKLELLEVKLRTATLNTTICGQGFVSIFRTIFTLTFNFFIYRAHSLESKDLSLK